MEMWKIEDCVDYWNEKIISNEKNENERKWDECYIYMHSNDKLSFQYTPEFGVNYAYPELIEFNLDKMKFPIRIPQIIKKNEDKLTEHDKYKILLLFLMQNYLVKSENSNKTIPLMDLSEEYDSKDYTTRLISNKIYMGYLEQIKYSGIAGFIIEPNFKRLLLIANFDVEYESFPYYATIEFEKMGIEVVLCSTDPNLPMVFDYHLPTEFGYTPERGRFNTYYPMSTIMNDCNPDKILICQNSLGLDFFGVEKDVYFYATKIAWKNMPIGVDKFRGFFYSYYGGLAMHKNNFAIEMNNIPKQNIKFVPWGWHNRQYPTFNNPREIFFGFMGSYDLSEPEFDPDEDPISQNLMSERNDIIRKLQELNNAPFKNKKDWKFTLREKGSDEEYREFISNTQLFLNVGADYGKVNQRMYHVIGSGAVLVQKYFRGIEKLGFEHGLEGNCIMFKDVDNLTDMIDYLWKHPDTIEKIRKNGLEFIQKHKLENRVMDMLLIMNR